MNSPKSPDGVEPYTMLRAALSLFQKPPLDLDERQFKQVTVQARNEFEIETRVLNSQEASSVIVSDQELEQAYIEVMSRFESDAGFLAALQANHLNEDSLRQALARQCRVEAVMERIAARAPKISEVEIGIFYHSHPEKFHVPEQRMARHILISINDDYPENTRDSAWNRITALHRQLQRKPHKFADLALRHSECPTALNGGLLGTLMRGKLYPELDAALFMLRRHEVSGVLESEVGFHLIQCQKIVPAETLSLQKAAPKIKQLMQERARRTCQRTWLASLPNSR